MCEFGRDFQKNPSSFPHQSSRSVSPQKDANSLWRHFTQKPNSQDNAMTWSQGNEKNADQKSSPRATQSTISPFGWLSSFRTQQFHLVCLLFAGFRAARCFYAEEVASAWLHSDSLQKWSLMRSHLAAAQEQWSIYNQSVWQLVNCPGCWLGELQYRNTLHLLGEINLPSRFPSLERAAEAQLAFTL